MFSGTKLYDITVSISNKGNLLTPGIMVNMLLDALDTRLGCQLRKLLQLTAVLSAR